MKANIFVGVRWLNQREMKGLCRLASLSSSEEERWMYSCARWTVEAGCFLCFPSRWHQKSKGKTHASIDAFRLGCPGDLLALS